jgi:hypothetical protein
MAIFMSDPVHLMGIVRLTFLLRCSVSDFIYAHLRFKIISKLAVKKLYFFFFFYWRLQPICGF